METIADEVSLGLKTIDIEMDDSNIVYWAFLLILFILLTHIDEIRNWNEIETHDKAWILSIVFGVIVMGAFSLIKLFGFFPE